MRVHLQLVTTSASLSSKANCMLPGCGVARPRLCHMSSSMQQHDVVPNSGKRRLMLPQGAFPCCRYVCGWSLQASLSGLQANDCSEQPEHFCCISTEGLSSLSWCPFRSAGAHEAGHRVAAAKHGVKLSPPFLLPSALGLLGSFGAITRFRSTVPNRQADLVRSRQGCMSEPVPYMVQCCLCFVKPSPFGAVPQLESFAYVSVS